MPRDKKPPESTGDIPAWFMTYSDVITLLMTFFILLMTFATNEPERFERMQISMFGGSGATGIAGNDQSLELDSLLVRERPRTARLTLRGAETPSAVEDPGLEALKKGLAGLDGPQQFDPQQSHAIDMPLVELFDGHGELTSEARGRLFQAAVRIKRGGLRAALRAEPAELDRCLQVAEFLVEAGRLHPSSVGVGALIEGSPAGTLQLELRKLGEQRR